MSGPFLVYFKLYLIDSSKVILLKVAKFGSIDNVELHWDTLQPGGQLESQCLVFGFFILKPDFTHST